MVDDRWVFWLTRVMAEPLTLLTTATCPALLLLELKLMTSPGAR